MMFSGFIESIQKKLMFFNGLQNCSKRLIDLNCWNFDLKSEKNIEYH